MNDSLALPALCILTFVIEEVIPMLIVLDWSFMEIFVIKADMIDFNVMQVEAADGINEIREQLVNHVFEVNIGAGQNT